MSIIEQFDKAKEKANYFNSIKKFDSNKYNEIHNLLQNFTKEQIKFFVQMINSFDAKTAQILIETGLDISTDPKLFVYFCGICRADAVKVFVDNGAKINYFEDEPLCAACDHGSDDVVKVLLENGAKITEKAIAHAIQKSSFGIIRLLLEYGADPNLVLKCILENCQIGNKSEDSIHILRVIEKFNPDYSKVIKDLNAPSACDDH
jgi:hypothetical protein